jgi:hypothetical protein
MVTTMMKKVEILENRVVFQLFTMLEDLVTTPKTHEYLLLWRCEVLKGFGIGWAHCIFQVM